MMPVPGEEKQQSPDMDAFVNWDLSADAMLNGSTFQNTNVPETLQETPLDTATGLPVSSSSAEDAGATAALVDAEALLFAPTSTDDLSFWAMGGHFDQPDASFPALTEPAGAATEPSAATLPSAATVHDFSTYGVLAVPPAPCAHCKQGGFQCKKIMEGNYKGYCTSCVALRCECSFGLASGVPVPTEISFPPNPWPTLGDHPDPIINEWNDEDSLSAIKQRKTSEDHTASSNASAAAALAALNIVPPAPIDNGNNNNSSSRSSSINSIPHNSIQQATPQTSIQPKLGARFSRESVRILKNWVSTHSRHPYPTEEEKESLQRLTGLNKTQISNWLANARRRGKIPTTRSTSPHVRSAWTSLGGSSGAIDIPQPRRSGTPSPFDRRPMQQNIENIPLQRWANSPPENEPASVSDIARAITSSSSAISSGLNSPHSFNFTDDGSGRSLFNGSSASSVGTSQSSGAGSFASAFSYASRGSFSSLGSMGRGRRRRRRRSAPQSTSADSRKPSNPKNTPDRHGLGHTGPNTLIAPLRTYQCTFCTETFKTKHDWQRHEKSLHLSLERWVCCPQGAVVLHPETKQPSCVFCGEADPDAAHLETHSFSVCQERSMADRTFYRKDHLRQHLKLVHGVKFASWSMDAWKVATPEIRSRCGFCGIVMDTWTFRIDHLADHFKTGRTMADWKGDWGFEEPVLQMVENSIPPYLIHDERKSPLPYSALGNSPASPRNAYELLRTELAYWLQGEPKKPADDDMLVEACRIVFASEMLSSKFNPSPSWLRDLVMSNEECARRARLAPIRSHAESRMATMRINGKDNLFDDCPLEIALHQFVHERSLIGLTPMLAELQDEACRIVTRWEADMLGNMSSTQARQEAHESDVVRFLLRMVRASTGWLEEFRQRAHLPRAEAMADETRRPTDDPNNIDATIHNFSRLEFELADYVWSCRNSGKPLPSDAELQSRARIIIYELDDGWNQTAADNPEWLETFKKRHMTDDFRGPCTMSRDQEESRMPMDSCFEGYLRPSPFFLNDTNCYRRLARELSRFVVAAMSSNNPNCHVPSDEELQHQARWILYDDDDPWNQTAADNAEWLLRFKRDVGILPADDGPGLPVDNKSWNVNQGGSGFAPPYCYPKMPMAPYPSAGEASSDNKGQSPSDMVTVLKMSALDPTRTVPCGLPAAPTNKYLQTFMTRYAKPASVFCSRELENGLADFVRETVVRGGQPFPNDNSLRAKAREILGSRAETTTAADDVKLLNKFKEMMQSQLAEEKNTAVTAGAATGAALAGASISAPTTVAAQTTQLPLPTTTSMPTDTNFVANMATMATNMDLDLSLMPQEELDSMLQEMTFDFDGGDLI